MKNLTKKSLNAEPVVNIFRVCILRLSVASATLISIFWGSLSNSSFDDTPIILVIVSIQYIVGITSLLLNRQGKLYSNKHLFYQLLIDVLFIAIYAYSTGGITNPFVNYSLVPISIASATLSRDNAKKITYVTILLYTLLLFFYNPQPFYGIAQSMPIDLNYEQTTDLNIQQDAVLANKPTHRVNPVHWSNWLNFIISALLIHWFVSRMAQAIRNQEKAINQQHEQQIYDEQILSIATIAASAAHELGTPINSLGLLIDEYTKDNNLNDHQREDFNLMESQIMQCSASLKKLVDTAQQTQIGRRKVIPCQQLIDRCLQEWQPLRPEVVVKKVFLKQPNEIAIFCDHSIAQALINLLNNAANSSPQQISIDLQYTAESISIIISDQGSGLPVHILEQYGKQPISDGEHNNSLGLGLFLSNASIRRHQGQLYLRNKYDNTIGTLVGAEAIIELPRWDEQNIEHN